MSLHSNGLKHWQQGDWSSNAITNLGRVYVTREQHLWTRFCFSEASTLNAHTPSSWDMHCRLKYSCEGFAPITTFARATVLFVFMDAKTGVGQVRHIPYTRRLVFILINATDRVGDRWQGRCFPSNLFAPGHGLHQCYSAEGYALTLLVYGNHAGTIVGNGVGRTPSKRASNPPWCHGTNIHGPARLLPPSMDSQQKVEVIFQRILT
jgi:hypothetical protein